MTVDKFKENISYESLTLKHRVHDAFCGKIKNGGIDLTTTTIHYVVINHESWSVRGIRFKTNPIEILELVSADGRSLHKKDVTRFYFRDVGDLTDLERWLLKALVNDSQTLGDMKPGLSAEEKQSLRNQLVAENI